jgi:hypothetical protein
MGAADSIPDFQAEFDRALSNAARARRQVFIRLPIAAALTISFATATVFLAREALRKGHPTVTVTVTATPRPTATVTVTAPARQSSAEPSAVPKPTATVTQFVAISSGGGTSAWAGIASVGTAVAGVGTLIGGYAAFTLRRRRRTEPVTENAKPDEAAT